MRKLWNVIDEMKVKNVLKNELFLGALIFINIVIGGAIWLILGRMILPGIDWFLCFMGYPAIFVGFFGGILYLYNHEFA